MRISPKVDGDTVPRAASHSYNALRSSIVLAEVVSFPLWLAAHRDQELTLLGVDWHPLLDLLTSM